MKKGVTIISSKAGDVFIGSNNKVIKKQKGGPAYFIQQALQNRNTPFNSIYKWNPRINLYLTVSGKPNEKLFRGKVIGLIPKFSLPLKQMAEYTIVSTIADEWNLNPIKDYKGKLFLDVQGYVRDPRKFSVKKRWSGISELINYIYCLKGTREEIKFLPQDAIKIGKNKLLIVTDGSNKVEVFHKNKRYEFIINEVRNCIDTIGAGDTFFGHFVASIYKGYTVEESVKIAIIKTRTFLKRKLIT